MEIRFFIEVTRVAELPREAIEALHLRTAAQNDLSECKFPLASAFLISQFPWEGTPRGIPDDAAAIYSSDARLPQEDEIRRTSLKLLEVKTEF